MSSLQGNQIPKQVNIKWLFINKEMDMENLDVASIVKNRQVITLKNNGSLSVGQRAEVL